MSQITKRLNGIVFGFYSPSEIVSVSVKEITNPLAFDQINRALKNGLYDPAMGVSPYERYSKCVTCGQDGLGCQGHLGHVQLLLPVYNPFLMDKLHKLLTYHHFHIEGPCVSTVTGSEYNPTKYNSSKTLSFSLNQAIKPTVLSIYRPATTGF